MTNQPELTIVPPGDLLAGDNVRTDLHLDKPFCDSVASLGVLNPIQARRDESGRLVILAGHRRAAAAVQAGLPEVPVLVVPEPDSEAGRVIAQVAENAARRGLTAADQVAAQATLAGLGVSMAEAARSTGLSRKDVKAARAVAAVSDRLAGHLQPLDLEQAALIAEFDGHADRTDALLAASRHGTAEMKRRAELYRREDATAARLEARAEQLRDAGYAQVITDPDGWRKPPDGWHLVGWLADSDGNPLADDDHRACRGRAALVLATYGGDVDVHEYCCDPQGNGHVVVDLYRGRAGGQAGFSEEERQAQKDERRRVIANNKAWAAAEPVRRDHLANWLAGAKPNAAIVAWLADELLQAGIDDRLRAGSFLFDGRVLPGVLTSTPEQERTGYFARRSAAVAEGVSQPKAVIAALAVVLADREAAASREHWRSPRDDVARYLRFLADHTGYQLGDVERLAARLHDDATDQDPQPDPATVIDDPLAVDPLTTDTPAAAGQPSASPAR